MKKLKIKINVGKSVFNPLYWPFKEDNTPTQIFYGGAGAGKSVFVAQRLVLDLLKGGRNYLVVRKVARLNRQSTFAQINQVIQAWGLDKFFVINKSDLTITCLNGYQALFAGLDDVEKLKSILPARGPLTDIWLEEATEATDDDRRQLEKRLRGISDKIKRMTYTFNPILRNHWLFKVFFKDIPEGQKIYRDRHKLIIHATYKDNRFLTQQDIDRLESEQNEYYYMVYTEGKWGILGDVIFTNWEAADLSGIADTLVHRRYGLDFGFADNPTALVEVAYDRAKKTIYILNEVYQTGLTNPEIAQIIKPIVGNNAVVCDSAEPKSIEELKQHGIAAIGAEKGKDSVLFGIQWLKQHKIIIDQRCQNTINEFQLYQWQKNKAGETLQRPIDKNDHAIDALRYALEQDMKGAFEMEYETVMPRVSSQVDIGLDLDIRTF